MTARSLVATIAAALVIACASTAAAVPARELMARSQSAAARQDWNESARALEELVSAGIDSSDVLYDLGTVYAQAGRFGEGIWRLEQVNRRSPFAGDAAQNLRAARLRLAHRDAGRTGRAVVETATPWAVTLAELLPLDWAVVLTLVCELLALAFVFVWRRRGSEVSRVTGAAAAIVLTGTALLFASIVVARQFDPPAAIVLHDGLRLLREPTADAIAEASVREGERVEVLARDGVFARVRTPTGASGWLSARDLGLLDE